MNNLIPIQPKSLLICLLMGLLSTGALAQVSVEPTSIASTTNGVRVAWTDPGPRAEGWVRPTHRAGSGLHRSGPRVTHEWRLAKWGDEISLALAVLPPFIFSSYQSSCQAALTGRDPGRDRFRWTAVGKCDTL